MRMLSLMAMCALGLGAPLGAGQAGQAWAISAPALAAESVEGKIKSVDKDGNKFVLTVESKDMEFKVNDQTVYTLDGRRVGRDDALKAGHKATVTHTDRTASNVAAKSQ